MWTGPFLVDSGLRPGAHSALGGYADRHQSFPVPGGDLDLPRQIMEPVIQCGYMRIGGGHGNATRVF